jgi:hypothetical protein
MTAIRPSPVLTAAFVFVAVIVVAIAASPMLTLASRVIA